VSATNARFQYHTGFVERERGTTKPHRLAENLGAVAIQLTADDLKEMDRAAAEIPVQGARYTEHLQKMVGR
jgi:diketogulonate reductase-like aldo/keto reductase